MSTTKRHGYHNFVNFLYLKRTVPRDFRPPVVSSFKPVWVTDQWVTIFELYMLFCWDILTSASQKVTRRGIIPRGDWLAGEIDSWIQLTSNILSLPCSVVDRNDLFRIRIQLLIFWVPDPGKSSGSMQIRIQPLLIKYRYISNNTKKTLNPIKQENINNYLPFSILY